MEIVLKSKIIHLQRGMVLCKKAAPANYFYVIISGKVSEVVTDNNDFSTSLKIEGKYDYYGELGILLDEGYSSTVFTLSEVEVLSIQREVLSEIVWSNRHILKLILQTLKERLQAAGQKEIALTQMNAECRMAYVLLTVYKNNENSNNIAITQEKLAINCGIARQTASIILNQWKKRGIIDLKRGNITINDSAAVSDIFLQARD